MFEKRTSLLPTVSDIVKQNYHAADVFRKWGINYCCGGNVPLADACALRGIEPAAVQQDIDAAAHNTFLPPGVAADAWPVDFLVDYIVFVHHAYLKSALPQLHQHLCKFVAGHAKKYPYLAAVEDVFNDLSAELIEHNNEEEERIFPYLRQVSSTYKRRETYGSLFVRNLGQPLDQQIEKDHKRIAALLQQLRAAANNYHFAPDACTNHQVIYHKLKELDNDLVQHKHLENNILFPKVLRMEKELLCLS